MSLFGLRERRSQLDVGTQPLTSAALLSWLGGTTNDSGISVTETGALAMSAVYRATALISSLGGALPILVTDRLTKEAVSSPLLDNPHPNLTSYDLWRLSFVHRCLWGNFYAQRKLDRLGRTQGLWPIRPERVQVGLAKPSEANPSGKMFRVTDDEGRSEPYTSLEIFHIPGLGYDGVCGVSPIRVAIQAIGLGLSAERFSAKLFGSGNLLSGILQTEQRLEPTDARRLQDQWRSRMSGLDRAHDVAVLDSGAKFQSMTMPNHDAQMLESRTFQVSEIARFFGVPPFLLQETTRSTSWGTGLEQQAIGFVQFDLHPMWLAPTEQRITKDLLPRGNQARYDVTSLLRGDAQSRAAFYQVMLSGVMTANEVRALEDLPPIEGGDVLQSPLNMGPAGSQSDSTSQNDNEGTGDAPIDSASQ